MYIFFNAASFDGQGRSRHHGGELLHKMMLAVEALQEIGASDDRMYRDEAVQHRMLTGEHTFKQVFDFRYTQIVAEQQGRVDANRDARQVRLPPERDRFRRLLARVTQSPFASQIFGPPAFVCECEGVDVAYQALGYTAHLTRRVFEGTGGTAAMVSLQECERFTASSIPVLYSFEDVRDERAVWNVTSERHVRRARRKYERNDKHLKAARAAGYIAEMDLNDQVAQAVLDRAAKMPGEERLIARHNGCLYLFPCHHTPMVPNNEREEQYCYHGFSITAADLRQRDGGFHAKLLKLLGWKELQ